VAGDGRNGFGCLTVLSAVALGAAVLAAGAAQAAPDLNTYSVVQENYGGAILAHGSGAQVTVSDTTNNTYELTDPTRDCTGGTGNTCEHWQDAQTGLCLKEDPNISGVPVVEYTCEDSGTVNEEEQWTGAPVDQSGRDSTLYVFDTEATDSTLCDVSGKVRMCPSGGSGESWEIFH
jgi:hypothetical protein